MFQQASSNQPRLRRLITTVLMVWLGGLNCLLCCGPNVLATMPKVESCAATAQRNVESPACAEDACCTEQDAPEDNQPPGEKECCILDAPAAALPHAPQLKQLTTVPAVGWLSVALATNPPLNISHLRPPLRGGQPIHLRCCVFLI